MPSNESLKTCLVDNWILEALAAAGKWLLIGVSAARSGADVSLFLVITGFFFTLGSGKTFTLLPLPLLTYPYTEVES
jgi:hypothetical protein